jgi:hypothetical protein
MLQPAKGAAAEAIRAVAGHISSAHSVAAGLVQVDHPVEVPLEDCTSGASGGGHADCFLCVSMRELWLDESSAWRLGVRGGTA